MSEMNRRAVLAGACASMAGFGLAGSASAASRAQPEMRAAIQPRLAALYGPVRGEPFPIPAAPLSRINPAYLRTRVLYEGREPPGTIVVDPRSRFLYLIREDGTALRYGVGVARRAWIEPQQVVNTWPLEDVLAWLRDRRLPERH